MHKLLRNAAKKRVASPSKMDPTRTAILRKEFSRAILKRFNRVKAAIRKLIVVEDAFGLLPKSLNPFIGNRLTANTRWRFLTDPQKVDQFRQWLQGQLQNEILTDPNETSDDWWAKYIEQGYKKGAARAFDDVRKPALQQNLDFFRGTKEEFLRQSFAQPVAIDKVKLLSGRVYTELKGVTDAMSQRLTRELTDGLTQGQSPRVVAAKITDSVQQITQSRALAIARTETVRAHAEGQLDALEQLGVTSLGVQVEWSTTGDDKVCPLCEPLEGIVLTITEARGLLPRHPNCRCAYIPAGVGEDDENQKDTKTSISGAIDASIDAERSKGSLEEKKEKTSWVGADKDIAKDRPVSILDEPEVAE